MPTSRSLPPDRESPTRRDKTGAHPFSESSPARSPASPFPEIEPRLFSFNNPFGACPTCDGLGHEHAIDPDLIVPDKALTLRKGAIAPWAKSTSPYYGQTLDALGKHFGFTMTTLEGPAEEGAERHPARHRRPRSSSPMNDGLRSYEVKKPFEGVITNIERRWKETESDWAREEIGRFMSDALRWPATAIA
jgi:excinuclease ABC subunit A